MLLFFIDKSYVYRGMLIEIRHKFKDTLKYVLELQKYVFVIAYRSAYYVSLDSLLKWSFINLS